MKCPVCRKPVEEQAPHYPFCSERCRTIDLGKWASEQYVISAPLTSEADQRKPDEDDR